MCDGFEVLETWGPGLPTGPFCRLIITKGSVNVAMV